jgi:hypothetical protein
LCVFCKNDVYGNQNDLSAQLEWNISLIGRLQYDRKQN